MGGGELVYIEALLNISLLLPARNSLTVISGLG